MTHYLAFDNFTPLNFSSHRYSGHSFYRLLEPSKYPNSIKPEEPRLVYSIPPRIVPNPPHVNKMFKFCRGFLKDNISLFNDLFFNINEKFNLVIISVDKDRLMTLTLHPEMVMNYNKFLANPSPHQNLKQLFQHVVDFIPVIDIHNS